MRFNFPSQNTRSTCVMPVSVWNLKVLTERRGYLKWDELPEWEICCYARGARQRHWDSGAALWASPRGRLTAAVGLHERAAWCECAAWCAWGALTTESKSQDVKNNAESSTGPHSYIFKSSSFCKCKAAKTPECFFSAACVPFECLPNARVPRMFFHFSLPSECRHAIF